MKFDKLVISIQSTHEELQRAAVKAVNQSLTVRNWLIGLYIVEFEQKGEDRAKYGERLLSELAESVKIRGLSETNLKLCRLFYTAYPHLISAIKTTLENGRIEVSLIRQLLTDELDKTDNQIDTIRQTLSDELGEVNETEIDQNNQHLVVTSQILSKLSFSHLVQLVSIRNLAKRTFYELECIQQAWSVGELKRQINTLYYERRKPYRSILKEPNKKLFVFSFLKEFSIFGITS